MIPDRAKQNKEIKYLSPDRERWGPLIGENVMVAIPNEQRYGTYRGTTEEGDLVLIPSASLAVVEGLLSLCWDESLPMYVSSETVRTVSAVSREYIDLFIKDDIERARREAQRYSATKK